MSNSEVNLTQYVQTETPVWVKITNGATGSLNLHGVVAKTYEKDCTNDVKIVKNDTQNMSFYNNILTFKSEKTCPAEISIYSVDGRKIDIPFRGWIEAGVDNQIQLILSHLNKGMYILMMTTNEGKWTLKIMN